MTRNVEAFIVETLKKEIVCYSPLELLFLRISTICHSDDRREEDVLLNELKNLGSIHNYIYEDVREILRFALNDNLVLTDISFKDYSALMIILAVFNPLPVAVKVMSPGLPFVWTMAVIMPLNTCIFGSWKSSIDTELPLAPAR